MKSQSVNPMHLDPESVVSAATNLNHLLTMIEEAWKVGDRELLDLVSAGMGPETGGFEKIGRGARDRVDDLLHKLSSDLLPFLLPHLDPALRDRIQALMTFMNPDAWVADTYGEEGTRWRQHWSVTGIEEKTRELAPILEAFAQSTRIEAARAITEASEYASEQQSKQPKKRKHDAAKRAVAAAVALEHPGISLRALSKLVGIPKSTLGGWDEVKRARKAAVVEPTSGHFERQGDDSRVEAVDDDGSDIAAAIDES